MELSGFLFFLCDSNSRVVLIQQGDASSINIYIERETELLYYVPYVSIIREHHSRFVHDSINFSPGF